MKQIKLLTVTYWERGELIDRIIELQHKLNEVIMRVNQLSSSQGIKNDEKKKRGEDR